MVSAIERQREPGAETGHHRALTGALGGGHPRILLAVTHELRLSCKQARVANLGTRIAAIDITGDGVVPVVAIRASGGVLSKHGEGVPPFLQTREYQPVVGDQLAHVRGNAFEEPARVELVPHRAGEGCDGVMQRGQVEVDRGTAVVARRGQSSPRFWSRCYPCEPGQRTRIHGPLPPLPFR